MLMLILDSTSSIGALMEKLQAPGGENNLTQKEREEWARLNTVLGTFKESLNVVRASLLNPLEPIVKQM